VSLSPYRSMNWSQRYETFDQCDSWNIVVFWTILVYSGMTTSHEKYAKRERWTSYHPRKPSTQPFIFHVNLVVLRSQDSMLMSLVDRDLLIFKWGALPLLKFLSLYHHLWSL
jgi:hypothetical protein